MWVSSRKAAKEQPRFNSGLGTSRASGSFLDLWCGFNINTGPISSQRSSSCLCSPNRPSLEIHASSIPRLTSYPHLHSFLTYLCCLSVSSVFCGTTWAKRRHTLSGLLLQAQVLVLPFLSLAPSLCPNGSHRSCSSQSIEREVVPALVKQTMPSTGSSIFQRVRSNTSFALAATVIGGFATVPKRLVRTPPFPELSSDI